MFRKYYLSGLLILLSLILASCSSEAKLAATSTSSITTKATPSGTLEDKLMATTCQKTVAALSSIPGRNQSIDYRKDTPSAPGMFNVNEYFSVLSHLRVEDGYILDYFYHSLGGSGHPYIYARKVNQQPYIVYTELEKINENDWLNHIRVDGTMEGFFQFAVLRKMGAQFYLYWHSAVNDHTIICNRDGLEVILSAPVFNDLRIPPDVQEKARKLDFAPRVNLENDKINARIVYFTKWGGFIEETSTVSRNFPHKILDTKTQTLVAYNCGVSF